MSGKNNKIENQIDHNNITSENRNTHTTNEPKKDDDKSALSLPGNISQLDENIEINKKKEPENGAQPDIINIKIKNESSLPTTTDGFDAEKEKGIQEKPQLPSTINNQTGLRKIVKKSNNDTIYFHERGSSFDKTTDLFAEKAKNFIAKGLKDDSLTGEKEEDWNEKLKIIN